MLALPAAMLFPALWAFSPSRTVAALVSAGYFLAASRGLPQGVANFYATDLWPGLLLWVAASLTFVVVHAVAWSGRPGRRRALRFLAAAVLMAVPPCGIVGWAHPVTAAGVLFPGWGWWGLGATVGGLAIMTTRWWSVATIALGSFWMWSAATWMSPVLPEGWTSVVLEMGQSLGRDTSLVRHRDLIERARNAAGNAARVVVLPESALGFWTPTIERFWRGELQGVDLTVIAGAAIVNDTGYDNVMVAILGTTVTVLYRERMPVPISMWQPWRRLTGQGGGSRAYFFDNPVVEIDGTRVATLICYEQLVVWPVLQSMLHSPDIIVATGNGWWTAGTSIVATQKANVEAWAKLFDRPIVLAFNT